MTAQVEYMTRVGWVCKTAIACLAANELPSLLRAKRESAACSRSVAHEMKDTCECTLTGPT